MNPRQPLTIRSTVWLVMALTVASTSLGAVGLHSYRLHRQAHLGERLRTQAIAETYAAQIGPSLTTGPRADLAAFIRELPWHQNSRLIALLDQNGETLIARGAAQILDRYDVVSSTSPGPTWHVKGRPAELALEYTLAAVPLRSDISHEPLGTLVYAMVTPANAGPGHTENWGFFIQISLIAAAGLMMGFLWLKRSVLDPLTILAAEQLPMQGIGSTNLPVERSDEIGRLARTLAHLQTDVSDWRGRADSLERTINARVAHATERITRELKKAQKKTWTDPLILLGNRRLLDEKFDEIFQAQQESGQELSIVMIDMDNFKPLNDSLGHRAGDELLQFTGELLQQCLREQDLAVRYGGDEFVLVLPSVAPKQAQAIAERTIALFAQRTRLLPVSDKPTMSAGIASLQRHGPASADALLQMADAALYHAKSSGKARACIYTSALLATRS
jgi:diguanylate cyclase (GGDEF)-like protein